MGNDDFLCSDSRKVTDDGLGSCRGWLESQIIQMHNRNELTKALLTGNRQAEACVDREVEDDVGWGWFERRVNLKWNVSSVRRALASPGHRRNTPQKGLFERVTTITTNYHKYRHLAR